VPDLNPLCKLSTFNQQRKRKVVVKLIPLHEKQPLQVIIPKKLAICLVVVLAPATSLAILSCQKEARYERGTLTLLQYQKKPHFEHFISEVDFLSHP
jgi:hypothetical protein